MRAFLLCRRRFLWHHALMQHDFIQALDHAIETELLAASDSLNEHQLIVALQAKPYELLEANALTDTLRLFQTHFIVFNALYRLRNRWRQAQLFELDIHTLKIAVKPYEPADSGLDAMDPLAAYYLDWAHFEQTRAADVDALLDDFWHGRQVVVVTMNDIDDAVATLALPAWPVSPAELKRTYRHCMHQHHPDKGGCVQQAQAIKQAYRILQQQLEYS